MKNPRLITWSITSALAGFLFGFDTVVISGAEQRIRELWELSSSMHGLCLSMALWGTVLGSLMGSIPCERFGRKKTLISIGLLYFVSAIGSAIAQDPYSFMVARFIGGVGIGVATIAAPLYISEISPANMRGRLAGMFQFNIVFGILIAFVSNYFIGRIFPEDVAWRWMLGIEALPAIVYGFMCFCISESPRWLIIHEDRQEEAAAICRSIYPDMTDTEIQDLVNSIAASTETSSPSAKKPFFTSRLKLPIILAFLIAFFNQLSGINAILYFAPRIFQWTGLEESAALLQSVGIGITNLIFTFVGLYLIDTFGRRTLLYIGSFGYIISLGLCSYAFSIEYYAIVPFCIFAFIAAHAVGQGAVIWVFISEIFPNAHRAVGQALGSFTHWFFAASLTLVFPIMADSLAPAIIFGFFCFMMILQLIWVKAMVPETKQVPLEEIEIKLGVREA
ncbi:MAG: sugar porter family MFS transporter [Planctomycetes bacterium]|nr:sugar porter family MFS transporter [Planctomycetota bacterium]